MKAERFRRCLEFGVVVALTLWFCGGGLLAQEERSSTADQVEVGLVEKVAEERAAYRKALAELVNYYSRIGNDAKRKQAQEELDGFDDVVKHEYVILAYIVDPNIKPIRPIPEADRLYKDGMEYKRSRSLLFNRGKKKKLHLALERFKEILLKYPESDKCDDAAYRIAQIYEGRHFRDPVLAVKYYEKCFQWDPQTSYDARYCAARIYDLKLRDLDNAIRVYALAAEKERDELAREKAEKRLAELKKKQEAQEAAE